MVKLTVREFAALKMCLNYTDRDLQLQDNFSDAGAEEFARELFKGDRQAAGGLIASLTKKGLGVMDDGGYDIFWLSEFGIHTIFNLLDET